jgi:hypothetical protein
MFVILLLSLLASVNAQTVFFNQELYPFNVTYCEDKTFQTTGPTILLRVMCPLTARCASPLLVQDMSYVHLTASLTNGVSSYPVSTLGSTQNATLYSNTVFFKPYYAGTLSCVNNFVMVNVSEPVLTSVLYSTNEIAVNDNNCGQSVEPTVVTESTVTTLACAFTTLAPSSPPTPSQAPIVPQTTSAASTLRTIDTLFIVAIVVFFFCT